MQDANYSSEGKKLATGRSGFISAIIKEIEDRIFEECLNDDKVFVVIRCKSGSVEVSMKSDGTNEVAVCHNNDHTSPTLEATITGMLPDWWSVQTRAEEEERKEQEFRDYLWRNFRYM